MRTKKQPGGKASSFIEQARRRQIIESTIASVAAEGYAGSSLANVAKRAGTSKGVVLYHFRGKDELVEMTVSEIFRELDAFMSPRLEAESTARGRLRVFIESELLFLEQHRAQLLTLSYLLVNHRNRRGELYLRTSAEEAAMRAIGTILEAGRKRGEFRTFDVRPMAATILNALNGALSQWVADPSMSLAAYATELVTIFDLATQKPSRTSAARSA